MDKKTSYKKQCPACGRWKPKYKFDTMANGQLTERCHACMQLGVYPNIKPTNPGYKSPIKHPCKFCGYDWFHPVDNNINNDVRCNRCGAVHTVSDKEYQQLLDDFFDIIDNTRRVFGMRKVARYQRQRLIQKINIEGIEVFI